MKRFFQAVIDSMQKSAYRKAYIQLLSHGLVQEANNIKKFTE
jgi:hypothetical protein